VPEKRIRHAPLEGTRIVWPSGLEARYGISPVTRWRWEKLGKLPARDMTVGGRTGWRPETLAKAETLKASPSSAAA
jgi:hypothetical protein